MKCGLIILAALLFVATSGCRSDDARSEDQKTPGERIREQRAQRRSVASTIVHVNPREPYVLLENFVDHSVGSVLVVMRHNEAVGRIRITAPARKDLITADILSGELQKGDVAYLE